MPFKIEKSISIFLFSFLCLLVQYSCSKKNNENDSFAPPEWLIGTWDHENPDALLNAYIVTADNIVLEYPDGDLLDYGARARENEGYYIREITNTSSVYKYELVDESNQDPNQDYIVTFTKVSENEITVGNSLELIGGSTYTRR